MRIAVIGGAGNMGRLLVTHFLKYDNSLVVSDPRIEEIKSADFEIEANNIAAVRDADLVMISVPMEKTEEVILEIAPHMKENSILCEISTLKSNVVEVLRSATGNQIRPLCIHPLFGQGASTQRKRFALVPVRDVGEEKSLMESLFPESQIIIVEADEHDRVMALTLSLPYFINMILASILKDENIQLIEQLSGTTFAVQFMLTGSIMSHKSDFHLSLHKENKYSLDVLRQLQSRIEDELVLLVDDEDAFKRSYSSHMSSLETQVNLEEKYRDMYRVLEAMTKQKGGEAEIMNCSRVDVRTPSRDYPIFIGHDILKRVGEFLEQSTERAFLISDDKIPKVYLDSLTEGLSVSEIEVNVMLLHAGESFKTLDSLNTLYNFLAEHRASRSDTIVALGGGVIGDIAGFAASTFKRGLNLVQVPTSLLAQVDSSIGGKTGVNLNEAKNLVGSFYQPHAVIVDVETLNSLPTSDFVAGLAEVIKYGVTMDQDLFQLLIDRNEEILLRDPEVISMIVERALRNKARIVEEDEREERGHREILNFGHTIGHAIETHSSHSVLHGQAVAIGMVEEARIAVRMGLLESSVLESLILVLSLFGLPTEIPSEIAAIQLNSVILQDKKMKHGLLTIPILVGLGKTEMRTVEPDNILKLINQNGVVTRC